MLKSMTGYGREIIQFPNMDILVEVKSVNNRYIDTNIRLPRSVGYIEEKLKKLVTGYISRGKIDIYVSIERTESDNSKIELDEILLKEYLSALNRIKDVCGFEEKISLSSITRFTEIFNKKSLDDDEDVMWSRISETAEKALINFDEMRCVEGENLYNDLNLKLDELFEIVCQIEELSPNAILAYRERLEAKIKEYINDDKFDESRVLTEVAIISDKIATDEERTRLRSHIEQFKTFINSKEPVGKKLDFLIQELNREVNTIGSKCQMIEISKLVIEAKSIIEKIREQIQNIE